MLTRAVLLFLALTIATTFSGGVSAGFDPGPFRTDVNKLNSVATNLQVCEQQIYQTLRNLEDWDMPGGGNINALMNKLESIANKLEVLERRTEDVVARTSEVHVLDPDQPMAELGMAMERVMAEVDDILALIDQFLYVKPPILPLETHAVVQSLRDQIGDSLTYLGYSYYRAVIPIRFVQFVKLGDPPVSDERLRYSVRIVNEVFRPARLRFFIKADIIVPNSEFTYLYLRDEDDKLILDGNGDRQHDYYTWPEEWWKSPLIWPLHWPQIAECDFEPLGPTDAHPEGAVETRYDAQMRAGTYCCQDFEMLVYINQGRSNGGQYPWYSRIIGMSAGHMATPGSYNNRFVFAHEVGHFLGLPHTFPSLKHYGLDYDLARIVTNPDDNNPLETIRRYYEPHANLVNVETGQTAELSLFWDQVYKPVFSLAGPTQHMFFNNRLDAARWEDDLQPIQEWSNGRFCPPGGACCGEPSRSLRLSHTVGSWCMGPEDDFSDCFGQAKEFCTGHPAVRAFSRFGSDPDHIETNIMSYGYPMTDGSPVPEGTVESVFLCQSHLEQIGRVMTFDVPTKFFSGQTGLRPELASCEGCHQSLPAGARAEEQRVVLGDPPDSGPGPVLSRSFPNPTSRGATVAFTLSAPGKTELQFHDVAGRLVRRFENGRRTAGDHEIVWDGRDASGRKLPAGTYFYRLRISGRAAGTGKVVIVE